MLYQKNTKLLIISFIICFVSSCAPKKKTTGIKSIKPKSKVDIKQLAHTCTHGTPVFIKEKLTHGCIIKFKNKEKKFDVWKAYYKSGQLKSEGLYQNNKKERKWVHYHPNGKLKNEMHYKSGTLSGLFQEWSIDGLLIKKGIYKYDKKTGLWSVLENKGMKKQCYSLFCSEEQSVDNIELWKIRWGVTEKKQAAFKNHFIYFFWVLGQCTRKGIQITDAALSQWIKQHGFNLETQHLKKAKTFSNQQDYVRAYYGYTLPFGVQNYEKIIRFELVLEQCFKKYPEFNPLKPWKGWPIQKPVALNHIQAKLWEKTKHWRSQAVYLGALFKE